MAKFLNKEGIIDSLKTIFEKAEKEIIIIVPFIKLSEYSYELLQNANNRNIEITIIFKEQKLSEIDRKKLMILDNLNLLSHPDIHAKCYCNENLLMIGSMNLYNYSEKYNREMAILIGNEDENHEVIYQDYEIHQNAIEEVKSIIKSSIFEKKSKTTNTKGFNLSLLIPPKEFVQQECNLINQQFDNKIFEVNDDLTIVCYNYSDNIDVELERILMLNHLKEYTSFKIHRVVINFRWETQILNKIHSKFKILLQTNSPFPHFKVYWDFPTSKLTLYRDRKQQPKWNEIDSLQTIKKFKNGIEIVCESIKKIERSLR